jgi:pyruvate carboxylase
LSNLRQQAIALGLGDRFEAIEDMYAAANRILGNIVKVTPSSKVVGDLALALVGRNADPADFEANPSAYDIPDSVIGFLSGELGDPPGGWPEPFRTKALAGRVIKPRVAGLTEEEDAALSEAPRATLNRLLFPGPTRDYEAAVADYSDLSVLPTREFLYGLRQGQETEVELERGKTLLLAISALGEPDDRGMRQAMCTINGQLRAVWVRDESITTTVAAAERANPSVPGQIPAPFAGVVTVVVEPGDAISAGQQIATIEAMKMEAAITSPVAGTVTRLAISRTQAVEGGDLLVEIH